MRRILVVSTVENADEQLRRHIGADDEIKVVVPVVRQGFLDWLANDERAFSHAVGVAQETGEALPGRTVDAVAGEADVDLALRDVLAEWEADEILIATRPDEHEDFIEAVATGNAPHNSFQGIPVRHVTIRD